jgi:hypothetical protein
MRTRVMPAVVVAASVLLCDAAGASGDAKLPASLEMRGRCSVHLDRGLGVRRRMRRLLERVESAVNERAKCAVDLVELPGTSWCEEVWLGEQVPRFVTREVVGRLLTEAQTCNRSSTPARCDGVGELRYDARIVEVHAAHPRQFSVMLTLVSEWRCPDGLVIDWRAVRTARVALDGRITALEDTVMVGATAP